MPNINLNNIQEKKIQTLAQWAADGTVYALGYVLIASDEPLSDLGQVPVKIANGVSAWSALSYNISKDVFEAITNSNSANSGNPFATINDIPVVSTPGLDDVLRQSNVSDIGITSSNGRCNLVFDGSNTYLSYENGATTGYAAATPTNSFLSWSNGVVTGQYSVDVTRSEVSHTTEINLSSPSVKKNGSEIATEAFAQSLVVGLLDDRGNWDASVNLYPNSGGSGAAGAILRGDIWTVSVAGTMGAQVVTAGDLVRALVDSPGQTNSNWAVTENNIGYVAENANNKSTSVVADSGSNTKYPSVKSVYDWVTGLGYLLASTASSTYQAILTDSVFGTLLFGFTSKTTPVDADSWSISDSADSNKGKRVTGTNLKAYLKSYFDGIYTTTSAVATQITMALSSYALSSSVPKIEIMTGSLTVFSPLDSTTTYFSSSTPLAPSTTDTTRPFQGVAGTIKSALIYVDPTSTLGSNENVTYNLWNITDAVSVGTIGTITYDRRGNQIMYTGLSLAVLSTKLYAIQIVNPVYATNPTNCYTTCKLVVYP